MLANTLLRYLAQRRSLTQNLRAHHPLLAHFGVDGRRPSTANRLLRFIPPYTGHGASAWSPLVPEALPALPEMSSAYSEPEQLPGFADERTIDVQAIVLPSEPHAADLPADAIREAVAVHPARAAAPPIPEAGAPTRAARGSPVTPPAPAASSASRPPTPEELHATLLALREQQRQPKPSPAAAVLPAQETAAPSRLPRRAPLGSRLVHLPGTTSAPEEHQRAAEAALHSALSQPEDVVQGTQKDPATETRQDAVDEAAEAELPAESESSTPPPEPLPSVMRLDQAASVQPKTTSGGNPPEAAVPARAAAISDVPPDGPVPGVAAELASVAAQPSDDADSRPVPVTPNLSEYREDQAHVPPISIATAPAEPSGDEPLPGEPDAAEMQAPVTATTTAGIAPPALAGAPIVSTPDPAQTPAPQPLAAPAQAEKPSATVPIEPAAYPDGLAERVALPDMEIDAPPLDQSGHAPFEPAAEFGGPVGAPNAPLVTPPMPLREGTRRFLRPLVGIDPADVSIHQDAMSHQLAAMHGAAALASGDEVLLAHGYADDTPTTRGLLAHELVHIAQQRAPRFVAPILRAEQTPVDAEAQAERVEARTTDLARADRSTGAYVPGDVLSPLPAVEPASQPPAGPLAAAPSDPVWNNLPAPWEPLPGWLRPQAAEPLAQAERPAPNATYSAAQQADSAVPRVQAAANERRVAKQPAAPPAQTAQSAIEPDLDALAQQVYGILKQRLAAERRRQGW